MDGGSSPAPDYVGQAQATAQGNLDNLKYQTIANRPTIQTPWGTQSWSQPDANGTQTESINLTPDTAAALKSQQDVQMNQSRLAQGMQSQVANTMGTPFNAPSMNDYLGSVPSVNTGFGGFSPTGVNGVNQQSYNPNSYLRSAQGVNQNFRTAASPVDMNAADNVAGAGSVNYNAPQFSDANRQSSIDAAYKASTGLLQPQWDQANKSLDENLQLQGLTPGTEAYNNSMQNQLRTQAQTQSQLANQAVLTGDQTANNDYTSQLAGFGAGNTAQNQGYNQGLGVFGANNTAVGQQFGQDTTAFTNQNAARGQAYSQALGAYGAQLNGQQASNAAQGQAFGQSMAGYGADQAAIQNQNQAQAQAYQQALGRYNTAYQSAYSNYTTPLNMMNAVMNGNQVANPNFGQYSQAGYVGGADLSTAAQNQGQFSSAQQAAQTAANNGTLGLIGTIGAAAMMY